MNLLIYITVWVVIGVVSYLVYDKYRDKFLVVVGIGIIDLILILGFLMWLGHFVW